MADKNFSKDSVKLLLGYKDVFEPKLFNLKFEMVSDSYEVYSNKDVSGFLTNLDTTGFNLVFDYHTWLESSNDIHGKTVLKDLDFLSKADLDTLRKLMTAHIRTERFANGHIASLISSGYMWSFMERLESLYNKME
jgi:hypothetical protein